MLSIVSPQPSLFWLCSDLDFHFSSSRWNLTWPQDLTSSVVPITHVASRGSSTGKSSTTLRLVNSSPWQPRDGKRQLFHSSKVKPNKNLPHKMQKITTNLFRNKKKYVKGSKTQIVQKKQKKLHKVLKCNKKCHQKAQNHDITHILYKTGYNFAKILPEIGFCLHKQCF